MYTLPYSRVFMPFGKIKIWNQPNGSKKIHAYISVQCSLEDTLIGMAIDGSSTMRPAYGYIKGWLGLIFPFLRLDSNLVEGQFRKISDYFIQSVGVEQKMDVIYWSTNSGENGIEQIGELNKDQLVSYLLNKPRRFGLQTRLAPAVNYFAEKYKTVFRGMYIFITNGQLDDLSDVKSLTLQLAQEIADGKRMPINLILLGVGRRIDEKRMKELVDFDTEAGFDLWDYKIASELGHISEIFTEVASDMTILPVGGLIRDARGKVVKEYSNTDLPALLEFTLPPEASNAFIFEFGRHIIRQPLL